MLRYVLSDLVEVVFMELLLTETDKKRSAAQLYLCWLRNNQCPKPDQDTETTSDATTISSTPSLPVEAPVAAKMAPAWDPPQGSILPNIRTKILHNGALRPMHVNTTTPIPFNTDLFEGKVLLVVNSAAETREPFVSLSKANKFKFELQVQGKFKRLPDGPIFFGGEITKKMELGMITRGICGGLLQMGRAVNAYMHHSFGDTKNVELPHITGPFWSSVDRLHITPGSQIPPPFLESFPEEAKARAARKANPEYTVNVDLETTYSFSLKTSKMDLEEWAIATSSYTKSMNLSMFWADADLRFVCYCVPANTPGVEYNSYNLPKLHPQDKINHFFSLEVQHVSNHTDWVEEETSAGMTRTLSYDDVQLLQAALPVYPRERYQGYESVRLNSSQLTGILENEMDDSSPRMSLASVGSVLSCEDIEETEFHDAVLGPEHLFQSDENETRTREFVYDADKSVKSNLSFPSMDDDTLLQESTEEVSALLREKLSLLQDRIMTHSAKHLQEHKSEPFPKKRASVLNEPMIVSTKVKRSLVAAVLEVDDERAHKRGKRRTLYAFLANPADLASVGDTNTEGSSSGELVPRRDRKFVLRSFGEWKKALPIVKQRVIPPCQSRYSDDMKRKASLTWSYETVLLGREHATTRTELARFLADTSHNEAFLTPSDRGVGSKRLRESLPSFTRESLVCVQQSNYFWSQECMGLCAEELVFIKPSKLLGTAVRLRIPITDIISVRKVSDGDHPLPIPGFYCLMVATFARQYTILVRGLEERDGWLAALQSQSYVLNSPARRRTSSSDRRDSDLTSPLSFSTLKRAPSEMTNHSYNAGTSMAFAGLPASHLEGMIAYPPDWNLGDKIILNGRNFTCNGVYHQLSLRTLELGKLVNDPCTLVAKLLEMAFKLSSEEPGAAEVSVWVTDYAAARPPDLSEPIDFQTLWVDFMDGVSLLQCIDLSLVDKSSPQATCLFLNLYHCLLIHAYLVVGLPNSLFKWSNFFRFCSYEAFGDIFSLAELEHCILRGGENQAITRTFIKNQQLVATLAFVTAHCHPIT